MILLGPHVEPPSSEMRRLSPPTSSGRLASASDVAAGAQGEENRPSTNAKSREPPAEMTTGWRKQGKPWPEVQSEAVVGGAAALAAPGASSSGTSASIAAIIRA
jgi:hypothetical protein